jgi:hypothetical protein
VHTTDFTVCSIEFRPTLAEIETPRT